MDRWALYTAGKISKPTRSPQLSGLESPADFVIEPMDNHSAESSELRELGGTPIAMDSVAVEEVLGGHCSVLERPGFISRSSQIINRRREKLWHESCRPGPLPPLAWQAAVGGFALIVFATVTSVVIFWR